MFRLLVAKCLKIQFKIAKLSLMCRHNTGSSFELGVCFMLEQSKGQCLVTHGKRTIRHEDCDENEWNSSHCLKKHVEAKLKYTRGLPSSVLYCSVAVRQFGQMRAVSEDHRCLCVCRVVCSGRWRTAASLQVGASCPCRAWVTASSGSTRRSGCRCSLFRMWGPSHPEVQGSVCVCVKRKCGWAGVT